MQRNILVIIFSILMFSSCQKRFVKQPLQQSSPQEKIEIRIEIPESIKKITEMETVYDGLYFPDTYFDSIRRERYNTILSQLDTSSISKLVLGRNGVRVLFILPDRDPYYFKFIWDEDKNTFSFRTLNKEIEGESFFRATLLNYKYVKKMIDLLDINDFYSEPQTIEEIDFSIPVYVIEIKYNDRYYAVERNNLKKNSSVYKLVKYMERLNKASKKIMK